MMNKMKFVGCLSVTAVGLVVAQSAWAAQMYANTLAGEANVPAANYDDIVIRRAGLKATAFSSQAAVPSGGSGSVANIIQNANNSTQVRTHTVSGWFNVGDLPTGADRKVIYFARSVGGTDAHGGYRAVVDADGKIYVGKANGAGAAGADATLLSISSEAVITANTWVYLTFAVTNVDANDKRAEVALFVNGVAKTMTGQFATNLNGNDCNGFFIGAGVSASGLYIDTEALTTDSGLVNYATSPSYVEYVAQTVDVSSATDITASDIFTQHPAATTVNLTLTEGAKFTVDQEVFPTIVNLTSVGELKVNVAAGLTFRTATISGATSVVKGGSGNIVFTRDGSYTSLTVADGMAATTAGQGFGAYQGGATFDDLSTITVGATATLDVDGSRDRCYKIISQGGTITNTGSDIGTSSRQTTAITLENDTTVSGNGWGIRASGGKESQSQFVMNGHTLTVDMNDNKGFILYQFTVTKPGKFVIVNGSLAPNGMTVDYTDAELHDGDILFEFPEGATPSISGITLANLGDFAWGVQDNKIVVVSDVAQVGGQKYPKLVDAIAAAGEGEAIEILANVSEPAITLAKDVTFSVTSGAYTIATVLEGTGNITKVGEGTLTLAGANTFTGTTTVSAGVLKRGNNAAFGPAANEVVVVSGATLDMNNVGGNGNAIKIAGAGAEGHPYALTSTGTLAGFGSITLTADATIGTATSFGMNYGGNIIGLAGFKLSMVCGNGITATNMNFPEGTLEIASGRYTANQWNNNGPETTLIICEGATYASNVDADDRCTFKNIVNNGTVAMNGTRLLRASASYTGTGSINNLGLTGAAVTIPEDILAQMETEELGASHTLLTVMQRLVVSTQTPIANLPDGWKVFPSDTELMIEKNDGYTIPHSITLTGGFGDADHPITLQGEGTTVKLGSYNAIGANGATTIVIPTGTVFDNNGQNGQVGAYTAILSGGMLQNTVVCSGVDATRVNKTFPIRYLEVTADSTVGGTQNFGIVGQGWGESSIALGDNTLTKVGANTFDLVATTITGTGTFAVEEGTLAVNNNGVTAAEATIDVGASGTLRVEAGKVLTVKNLKGSGLVKILGTAKVTGSLVYTGAPMNLEGASSTTGEGEEAVTTYSPVNITDDDGIITIEAAEGVALEKGAKVVSWPQGAKPTVKFRAGKSLGDQMYTVVVGDTGITLDRRSFVISIF